jgi:chromosomal replication initiator protein
MPTQRTLDHRHHRRDLLTMTERTPATTWIATLGQLEMLVTRANFDTWLRDTVGMRHEDGCFVVGVQSDFAREWLAARLRPLITRTLARVLGHPVEVSFEVDRPAANDTPVLLSEPDGGADEIPPFLRRSSAPPALNPALTFEAFVVGDENRLAFEAARRAAEHPGAVNPLVIFGPAGLGKTHLLSAIGHAAYAQGRRVLYATAEKFGNDYSAARDKDHGYELFRRRYREVDVLLIDDITFLEGKEKYQEQLFHAFNDMHAAGKQVVVTADRPPSNLGGLIDALRSRLQWGLAADLQRPAFPTRLAILRAKARQHALRLPDAALEIIAERACPTVRELEGYLNRVLAFVPLVGGSTTRDVIEKALSPLTQALPGHGAEPLDADAIIAAVCRQTGVTGADLRGRSRARDVTYARHLAMFLLKEDARKSVAEIGRMFGHRDHSTVLAGIARIGLEQTTRPETRSDIATVRESAAPTPLPVAAAG